MRKDVDMDTATPMFPIGIVAEILKVHQRTLRIYDEEKILSPTRSEKNRRTYSFNDIEKGKFIQYLTRTMGINLAGVKVVFYLLKQLEIPPNKHLYYMSEVAKALKF